MTNGATVSRVNGSAVRLSGAAVTALLNAQAGREGAAVTVPGGRQGVLVLAELSAAGLIGPQHGLTRAGVIRRERESAALLDELF